MMKKGFNHGVNRIAEEEWFAAKVNFDEHSSLLRKKLFVLLFNIRTGRETAVTTSIAYCSAAGRGLGCLPPSSGFLQVMGSRLYDSSLAVMSPASNP